MAAISQSSPVARKLFEMAYASKRVALRNGDLSGGRFGPMWDRLVFSKVRARLGGGRQLLFLRQSSSDAVDTLMVCEIRLGTTRTAGSGFK